MKPSTCGTMGWPGRIMTLVEVVGAERAISFLSNNFTWSAQTIVDLYRCRWEIEVF